MRWGRLVKERPRAHAQQGPAGRGRYREAARVARGRTEAGHERAISQKVNEWPRPAARGENILLLHFSSSTLKNAGQHWKRPGLSNQRKPPSFLASYSLV